MARHPDPVVTAILAALAEVGASVQVTRVATHGRFDVDLNLLHDGRRLVVNIKEESE